MAKAKPNADATMIEADDGLEEFERPVPVVKATDEAPAGMAIVRVLPKGDGKVATGHYDKYENAFTYYSKGDHLCIPVKLAKTQEDNGLVEIVSGGA